VEQRDLWASFQHDPRDPAVAPLRASDADRDIVQAALTDAFADGRLDREEYDERAAGVLGARTLGELPAYVADLVPDRPLLPARPQARPLVDASPGELEKRAEEKWRRDRRDAFNGVIGITVLTWTIWVLTSLFAAGHFYFPWPIFPTLLALGGLIKTASNREQIVEREVRKLEKRQDRERRHREQGRG
jgi:hypothetical protein